MIVPEMGVWLAGKCCRKTCNFGPCSREEEDGFKSSKSSLSINCTSFVTNSSTALVLSAEAAM
ncbi:hypothetical protein HanXRQr2_Chr05g0216871 [Helianthus annuus]|uniref:Uncharacterized protein n=1 Tax=Helianthus annuus TaxID=4232 RepID=A0A251UQ14_HELAN|nr:hypothetical protein HanXRQr2_Chr05g0216871 [Helianthus annuus]